MHRVLMSYKVTALDLSSGNMTPEMAEIPLADLAGKLHLLPCGLVHPLQLP